MKPSRGIIFLQALRKDTLNWNINAASKALRAQIAVKVVIIAAFSISLGVFVRLTQNITGGVPMNNQPVRYRIRFSKKGSLRFVGHIDLQTLIERALRRSGLPIRYSQGFNPKPRLNLASALPLGFISECELADIYLNNTLSTTIILQKLNAALPTDVRVLEVFLLDNSLPSLQSSLLSSRFRVRFDPQEDIDLIKSNLVKLLAREEICVERRRKVVDIKPFILETNWLSMPEAALELTLSATPNASSRPDEILPLIGVDPTTCLVERVDMTFKP